MYLHLGDRVIHPHLFFESLAYIVAVTAYLRIRRRFGDPLVTPLRWTAVAVAVAGAAIGAKVLFWLEDPRQTLANLHNPAYFTGGKTIIGALIGGLIAVELIKRFIGLRTSTGDLYAIPLALGIAIGRVGCFLTGLSDNTYGLPTTLPWAINFGDGVPRHPTQLYEIGFLLLLTPLLYRTLMHTRNWTDDLSPTGRFPLSNLRNPLSSRDWQRFTLPGDTFKLFMVAYVSFRLVCDFIKPYPRLFLGLGAIQWACALTLLYYSRDVVRWLRKT